MVDFWGLAGPGGPGDPFKRWGAKRPTFWKGLPDPRGSKIDHFPAQNLPRTQPAVGGLTNRTSGLGASGKGPARGGGCLLIGRCNRPFLNYFLNYVFYFFVFVLKQNRLFLLYPGFSPGEKG